MNIRLKNDIGMIKECKIGFSWTNFFFGFFTPLFRGDWKWMLIMILCAIFSYGLSWLVFPFIYNKLYINDLLSKGFYPSTDEDKLILINKGYITVSNIDNSDKSEIIK
ncbi:hypothetical protein [Peptacetobacter sp. AB800]|uniref:hypothetical protein n=1 Tax=Peptacetobacter sp. AB800 TaxID=3388428 RepID=UPI0039FC7D7F